EARTLRLAEALLAAAAGDAARAQGLLAQARGHLGPAQAEAFGVILEMIGLLAQTEQLYYDEVTFRIRAGWLLLKLAPLMPALTSRAAGPAGLHWRVPPFMGQQLRPLLDVPPPELLMDPQKRRAALDRVAAVYPDGLLQLFLGTVLIAEDRNEEAIAALTRAADGPSLFAVRRPALSSLALAEWFASREAAGPAR